MAFEAQDYRDWLRENPGGSARAYACEVVAVVNEVLRDLPPGVRPAPEVVVRLVPRCDD